MRKLSVSTLITLDGVIQDPGGFGEIEQGGWGNPYFTEDAQQDAYEHLMASDYFLCGRVRGRYGIAPPMPPMPTPLGQEAVGVVDALLGLPLSTGQPRLV
jgi:hypothetical protein